MSARGMVVQLPKAPGVYRFRDSSGGVLYIGRAINLRRRVGSYWTNPGQLAEKVGRIARIEAVSCCSEHEAAWLERNLLEQRLPPWNRTAGGQEVPVILRVDWHSGLPGVSVVHAIEASPEARHFGPYLGGGKVRLGAAALRRVIPLAYAGHDLHGAEHDMARVRGVDPTTRLALVQSITSVLERDATAIASVRAELINRRDVAAAALDFERAARVQAELDGFEWIVAEQHVTRLEPDEFDVFGWSGGILVHFEVRAGRVCTWSQRVCTEAAARARLAATPGAWLEFARRNGELAARLSQSGLGV